MTEKEQRFVREFLIDGNATQAAIRAGYSARTARSIGSENLTKPDIQAALEEARKPLESAAVADAKERREALTAILRAKDNPMASIKAIDTLNKMDGVYVEKHQHDGDIRLRWGG